METQSGHWFVRGISTKKGNIRANQEYSVSVKIRYQVDVSSIPMDTREL